MRRVVRGFMTPGMPRGNRIALGVATAWPPVWFFLLALPFLVWAVSRPDNSHDDEIITGFLLVTVGNVATGVLLLVLTACYWVHVVRNPRLDREKRWLWVVVVLTAGLFAMPVYWYFHVWGEPAAPPG